MVTRSTTAAEPVFWWWEEDGCSRVVLLTERLLIVSGALTGREVGELEQARRAGDVETADFGAEAEQLPVSAITSLRFHPDDHRLVIGTAEGECTVAPPRNNAGVALGVFDTMAKRLAPGREPVDSLTTPPRQESEPALTAIGALVVIGLVCLGLAVAADQGDPAGPLAGFRRSLNGVFDDLGYLPAMVAFAVAGAVQLVRIRRSESDHGEAGAGRTLEILIPRPEASPVLTDDQDPLADIASPSGSDAEAVWSPTGGGSGDPSGDRAAAEMAPDGWAPGEATVDGGAAPEMAPDGWAPGEATADGWAAPEDDADGRGELELETEDRAAPEVEAAGWSPPVDDGEAEPVDVPSPPAAAAPSDEVDPAWATDDRGDRGDEFWDRDVTAADQPWWERSDLGLDEPEAAGLDALASSDAGQEILAATVPVIEEPSLAPVPPIDQPGPASVAEEPLVAVEEPGHAPAPSPAPAPTAEVAEPAPEVPAAEPAHHPVSEDRPSWPEPPVELDESSPFAEILGREAPVPGWASAPEPRDERVDRSYLNRSVPASLQAEPSAGD